ncbi:MAG: HAD family hydrolase [Ruminococcaceae bacterium]|nr:HAD family hydrolase [Oscillospiraceae bacterium]
MKNYEYILFDLDGTITDPGEGITNSVAYSLKTYGINVSDKRELYTFIGPPLYASFMKYYGFSEEQAIEAVDRYREYYRDKGVFECVLYPEIKNLLERLYLSGKKIILATSKPEFFANQILEHFDIKKYFYYIAGATMDGSRIDKADIIKYALDGINLLDKSLAVMIGDRSFDIIGAKENGIASIGVTYGYGSREELENANANYICDTVSEIEQIILKKC